MSSSDSSYRRVKSSSKLNKNTTDEQRHELAKARRERNRIAAQNCRVRKQQYIAALEEQIRYLRYQLELYQCTHAENAAMSILSHDPNACLFPDCPLTRLQKLNEKPTYELKLEELAASCLGLGQFFDGGTQTSLDYGHTVKQENSSNYGLTVKQEEWSIDSDNEFEYVSILSDENSE